MLALRLPPDIEKRLDDLEDLYLAQRRVEENGPRVSLDAMIEKYGLGADDET